MSRNFTIAVRIKGKEIGYSGQDVAGVGPIPQILIYELKLRMHFVEIKLFNTFNNMLKKSVLKATLKNGTRTPLNILIDALRRVSLQKSVFNFRCLPGR
jgi:hypothetical protein